MALNGHQGGVMSNSGRSSVEGNWMAPHSNGYFEPADRILKEMEAALIAGENDMGEDYDNHGLFEEPQVVFRPMAVRPEQLVEAEFYELRACGARNPGPRSPPPPSSNGWVSRLTPTMSNTATTTTVSPNADSVGDNNCYSPQHYPQPYGYLPGGLVVKPIALRASDVTTLSSSYKFPTDSGEPDDSPMQVCA